MPKITFTFYDSDGENPQEYGAEYSSSVDIWDVWDDIVDDWFLDMEFKYGTIDCVGSDDDVDFQSYEIPVENRQTVLNLIETNMLQYGITVGKWTDVATT